MKLNKNGTPRNGKKRSLGAKRTLTSGRYDCNENDESQRARVIVERSTRRSR